MKLNMSYNAIDCFFEDTLKNVKCQNDTKAYIISIYSKYKTSDFDLSKDNITLLFLQAHQKQNFSTYQNIGDWLFYTKSLFPIQFKIVENHYYDNIAELSYYSCYKLINKQWKLFEELADQFQPLTQEINKLITTSSIRINKFLP